MDFFSQCDNVAWWNTSTAPASPARIHSPRIGQVKRSIDKEAIPLLVQDAKCSPVLFLGPVQTQKEMVDVMNPATVERSSKEAPPKPKRPRTAYNLFFRDNQEKITQMRHHYKKKTLNAAKIVSIWWNEVDPSIKVQYHEIAMEDKYRYCNEKK